MRNDVTIVTSLRMSTGSKASHWERELMSVISPMMMLLAIG